jgi:hypothetical protein
MQQFFIHFINYVWYLLRVSVLHCHPQGAWQSQVATHHATTINTSIHNILSTAPQLSISQKALETLPEDGNIMPKYEGSTIPN